MRRPINFRPLPTIDPFINPPPPGTRLRRTKHPKPYLATVLTFDNSDTNHHITAIRTDAGSYFTEYTDQMHRYWTLVEEEPED